MIKEGLTEALEEGLATAFREGNLSSGTLHYHLLLHVPEIYRNKDIDMKEMIKEYYRGKQPISDIKHIHSTTIIKG